MNSYVCLNCGHDMDKHGESGCVHKDHGGEFCSCNWTPSQIATAVYDDLPRLREEIAGLRRRLGWEDRS